MLFGQMRYDPLKTDGRIKNTGRLSGLKRQTKKNSPLRAKNTNPFRQQIQWLQANVMWGSEIFPLKTDDRVKNKGRVSGPIIGIDDG